MFVYSFEKLVVWQESKDFALSIYRITSEFPKSEKFGLISQLRRASISICSNIAESTAYYSLKNQSRFTSIALGSAIESLNQLILAKELGYLCDSNYQSLRDNLESITNKVNALRRFQLSNKQSRQRTKNEKRKTK